LEVIVDPEMGSIGNSGPSGLTTSNGDSDTNKLDIIVREVSRLKTIEEKVGAIDAKFTVLDSRLTVTEVTFQENSEKITQLELANEELLQYIRKDNLEINGVPEVPGENLRQLFVDFSKVAGFNCETRDIQNIHRVPSRNPKKPRPIIVKLFYPHQKQELLGLKPRITSSQLGLPGPDQKIFISAIILLPIKETSSLKQGSL